MSSNLTTIIDFLFFIIGGFIGTLSIWILTQGVLGGLFVSITGNHAWYGSIVYAIFYSIATFIAVIFLNWFCSNRKKMMV